LPDSAFAPSNTLQAASALHCTGRATPSAYLAKDDPPLLLPVSAQSIRGPDAMAHSQKHGSCSSMAAKAGAARAVAPPVHRRARIKWPVGISHMSDRTNSRHDAQQQKEVQIRRVCPTNLAKRRSVLA
jgi:hypothetical protein